ncbi:MAG TPA: hypothetical protein VGC13_23360 [Longimicrobium sp.]|jgi:hypothetical protein|uniref:hypothetical protein n=1 Tax=Longimicrobium sp. TaxID=2029185 RepID=UPI002EDADDFC
MTMKPLLARTLRRVLLLAVMVLAGQFLLYRSLFARVEFPPDGVDRVEVWAPDGFSHQVTDPARVAGVVAFVRSRDGEWMRVRNARTAGMPNARFYRGDQAGRWFGWSSGSIIIPSGGGLGVRPLSHEETMELQRLLGTGAPWPSR